MNKNSNALLIGNGINRLNGNNKSWEELLHELSNMVNDHSIIENIEHKPFTLIYDALIVSAEKSGRISETKIKKKVADLISKLDDNKYHKAVLNTPVKHILTTNYGYELEKATAQKFVKANIAKETKYNAFRRNRLDDKNIWHLHGETDAPNTIMLGHEHYSGGLQKIRRYLTGDRRRSHRHSSPFKRGNRYFDQESNSEDKYSWVDVFLRDDIHIIGFGLDYTEIDIWWLITYKARLKYKKNNLEPGKTIYYSDIHLRTKYIDEENAKISLLESLGVDVNKLPHCTDYKEQFSEVLEIVS